MVKVAKKVCIMLILSYHKAGVINSDIRDILVLVIVKSHSIGQSSLGNIMSSIRPN